MDSDQFDQLARFFGRGVHRRAALATLAALAAGGVEQATAKPKHKRHGRAAGGNGPGGPGGNSACDAFCHRVFGDTAAAGKCTSDAAHGRGVCIQCGADPANFCQGTCVNRQTDNHNCGTCGNQCPTGQTCGGGNPGTPGVCGCTPHDDATTCAGKCGMVTNNCGDAVDCTPLCQDCCAGSICWPRCNGVCVDRLTDNANCGDCGVTCGGDLTCYHGNCCTNFDPDTGVPELCVCAETGWACDDTPNTCCTASPFHSTCVDGVCPPVGSASTPARRRRNR